MAQEKKETRIVEIIPKQKRAKNRVAEHGNLMYLIKIEPEKFLVESLDKVWLGWFTKQEAEFK